MDTAMTLARSCSTCKFAKWGKGDYYYGSKKKQMGICFVLASPVIPVPYSPKIYWAPGQTWLAQEAKRGRILTCREYFGIVVNEAQERYQRHLDARKEAIRTAGERWDREKARSRDGWRTWADNQTREEYIALEEQRLVEFLPEGAEGRKETIDKAKEVYDSWKANYDWWQENWPKCRTCHRVTTCPQYEDQGKPRESVARQVVDGKHALKNR